MPAVQPLAPRAGPALVALYVLAGTAVLGIGTDVRRIVVIGQYLEGGTIDRALQADDLVALATLLGAVAAVVALVLAGRWLWRLRAGRLVLGGRAGTLWLLWAWLGLAAVAAAATVVTRVTLSAATPQEVRRADWLDVGSQVLVIAAAVAGIAAIGRITARHDDAAAAAGVLDASAGRGPRRSGAGSEPDAGRAREGGLRVVSEAEARASRGGEHGAREHGAP